MTELKSRPPDRKKKGLGRGLANLLSSTVPVTDRIGEQLPNLIIELPLFRVRPSGNQPRSTFDPKLIEELAQSIKTHGVIQPIIVCDKDKSGIYEILAGERRYRACKLAGLKTIPVIIKREALERDQAFELALIENIQRADLSPLEEAKAYQMLLEAREMTQEELAKRVGKDRSSVSNAIRLLKLHPNVLHALEKKQISVGHAKVLCGIGFEQQCVFLRHIESKKLSVRELEEHVQSTNRSPARTQPRKQKGRKLDPQFERMRKLAEERLGVRVQIQTDSDGAKGRVIVWYHELQVLSRVLEQLVDS